MNKKHGVSLIEERTKVTDNISIRAGSLEFNGDLADSFDFGENRRRRKLQQAGQKIETAAVRHAEDDVGHARYKIIGQCF